MKIKIGVTREFNLETSEKAEKAIIELDNWYRTHDEKDWGNIPEGLIDTVVKLIETATGLPFGDPTASETIYGVYAEDGNAIIEW